MYTQDFKINNIVKKYVGQKTRKIKNVVAQDFDNVLMKKSSLLFEDFLLSIM